ncbi:zinc finger protein [Dorcoceras hygrometricum]|uniref:Zinc finger protein n=1 Tax=Dorcoceras hygrometricum TaxID=472368 RepID=A0A2Z7BM78_9LAMI|nr:zinc finger protein [Dorcoceras hygrometricum]
MSQTRLALFCFFLFPLICPCMAIQQNDYTKIKGMFVFGSSLVDNGNNNFLPDSIAKVNYFPYGIDFPLGPSGRFTNGKNVIDLLGQKLGLPDYIPPFSDPSTNGSKIINGVNFASGGSGILDDTGAIAGNVISLNQQIKNFEEYTLPELEMQLGNRSKEILPQSLFLVGSGGNDYSLNYFMGLANSNTSIEAFTANLITTLSNHLTRLYNLGARKFVLMAINPNGCSPMAKARVPTRQGCIQTLNRAAHMFNAKLRKSVDDMKPQMPGSNLVFINSYKVIMDIIRHPISEGFVDAKNACCEISKISEGGNGVLCKREGSICENRGEYVYFDGLHPTEAVNVVIANKAFASKSSAEVYPFNIYDLSQV